MISKTQIDSISLRKAHLFTELSEALDFNELSRAFCLESQWVHRYGIESYDIYKDQSRFTSQSKIEEEREEIDVSTEENTLIFEDTNTKLINTPLLENDSFESNISKLGLDSIQSNLNQELSSEATGQAISDRDNVSANETEALINANSNEVKQEKADFSTDNTVYLSPPPRPNVSYLRKWLAS